MQISLVKKIGIIGQKGVFCITSGFRLPILVLCSHCYMTNNWLHYKSIYYVSVNQTTILIFSRIRNRALNSEILYGDKI